MQETEIVVPGSISNLGPAFDALAVAVDLYVRVRVLDVRPAMPDTIETVFAGPAPTGDNRIEVAFRRARAKFGRPAPGVRIEARSDIPVTAGLGSSAAAAIAGLRLYEKLTAPCSTEDLLAVAYDLEGHPDNASASLMGGLTVGCVREDGQVIARSVRWPEAVQFVVATPSSTLETVRSRAALPPTIPLRDAVFNLQRALLLTRALDTGRYEDLREALRDRWHQPARSSLVPCLAEALAIDHPAILGVCLSGAGSSVVAFARAECTHEAATVLSAVYHRLHVPHTIRTLCAHQPLDARALQHIS
jgi:homoserine kinase